MKKTNQVWTISKLQTTYKNIEFPEFQREPTVWPLEKKQLLIDSIFRSLDISNIYMVKTEGASSRTAAIAVDGKSAEWHGSKTDKAEPATEKEAPAQDRFECIDGRQRINAILSYLGLNEADDPSGSLHNKFVFKSTNELRPKEILEDLNDKSFDNLRDTKGSTWADAFLAYEFNVLEITEVSDEDDELNLMFLRLQGGTGLNPGEKLRAMKGRMHDLIFGESKKGALGSDVEQDGAKKEEEEVKEGLGKHAFFAYLSIPERRYAREQVAVQVAMNFFSLKKEKQFHRARFVDMQEFVGDNVTLSAEDEALFDELRSNLDMAHDELAKDHELRIKNRALGVSTFFFINDLIESKKRAEIPEFLKFLEVFLPKLREQVEKGIDIDDEYRDLLKFQTYVSQAAVEKYAIENRQAFLAEYFAFFKASGGEIKTTGAVVKR